MKCLPDSLLAHPSVFAVNDSYHIMVPTTVEALVSVKVGDTEYFDDSNGICRTSRPLHAVIVPQADLDREKQYTVRIRKVIARKPYFSETEDVMEYPYPFYPVADSETVRIFQFSDVHSYTQEAIDAAAHAPAKPDIVLFNGDVAEDSDSIPHLLTPYRIAGAVTEGERPCVFSRGNHDLRGNCAEILSDYCPTDNGRSYYTFRLGPVWGVVLDCGEDKADEHPAYGNMNCCHAFRLRETAFLRTLTGYDDPSIRYRLVINHVPFCMNHGSGEFCIEVPLYTEWAEILRETVKPHLMLCGHMHTFRTVRNGEAWDDKGQPCPTVITCYPKAADKTSRGFTGALITLKADGADVIGVDNEGNSPFSDTIAWEES